MKNYIIIIVLLYCSSTSLLPAQSWKLSKTPANYDVWDITMTSKKHAAAAIWDSRSGANAKIIVTKDGGKSWTEVYNEIFRGATAIDRVDNTTTVAVGGANNYLACWKSSNGLTSFSPTMSADTYIQGKPSFWSVDFVSSTIGYGGASEGKILKTTNAGNSWIYLKDTFSNGAIIAIHFVTSELGYIIKTDKSSEYFTGKELYKTTDGGLTWKKIFSASVLRDVYFLDENIGFCSGSNGSSASIWRTKDGGETWQNVLSDYPEVRWINGITFTSNQYVGYAVGGDRYANNQGAIFRTTDGGVSWEKEIGNLPTCLLNISFFEETNGVAVGTNGYTYYSEKDLLPAYKPEININSKTEFDLGTLTSFDEVSADYLIYAINPKGIILSKIYSNDKDFFKKGFRFDTATQNSFPLTLHYGEDYTFTVRFIPTQNGVFESSLTFTSNDASHPMITVPVRVEVKGETTPKIIVSHNMIDFSEIPTHSSSEQLLIIKGTTTAPVSIDSIYMKGNSNVFTIQSLKETPYNVTNIDSIIVLVSTNSFNKGIFHDTIAINVNNNIIDIPLKATYYDQEKPTILSSVSEINFGTLSPHQSETIHCKLYTKNNVDIYVKSITLDNSNSDFALDISDTLPFQIEDDDSLIVGVRVSFTKPGQYQNILRIESNSFPDSIIRIPVFAQVNAVSVNEQESLLHDCIVWNINENDDVFIIHCNPCETDIEVRVFSVDGECCFKQKISSGRGNQSITIDKNFLSNGLYYFVLLSDNYVCSNKVLYQK